MSEQHRAKKTKKNRKHGRNVVFCKVYKATHRREKNKVKKLERHLAHFPNDHCATGALGNCRVILK